MVIYADVIMNIKVVVLSLEDVDRTEGRNDFDLYKKTENTKHGSDRRYKMARIADFRCTYDNASGFGAWAAEDYGIKFPDAYTEHEMMVKLALAVKEHNGAAVCLLPFCHTLEAEALGGIIRLGDGVIGPVSSTSLISLEQYKTFSLPYFQKNVDFIKSQGGGFTMFKDVKLIKDCVMIDNQTLINYIEEELQGVVGQEYAAPAGRISVINEPVSAAPEEPVVSPVSNTYTVQAGDSLWSIAQKTYGTGTKWGVIYEANKAVVKDPGMIYIGQVLTVPAA